MPRAGGTSSNAHYHNDNQLLGCTAGSQPTLCCLFSVAPTLSHVTTVRLFSHKDSTVVRVTAQGGSSSSCLRHDPTVALSFSFPGSPLLSSSRRWTHTSTVSQNWHRVLKNSMLKVPYADRHRRHTIPHARADGGSKRTNPEPARPSAYRTTHKQNTTPLTIFQVKRS